MYNFVLPIWTVLHKGDTNQHRQRFTSDALQNMFYKEWCNIVPRISSHLNKLKQILALGVLHPI